MLYIYNKPQDGQPNIYIHTDLAIKRPRCLHTAYTYINIHTCYTYTTSPKTGSQIYTYIHNRAKERRQSGGIETGLKLGPISFPKLPGSGWVRKFRTDHPYALPPPLLGCSDSRKGQEECGVADTPATATAFAGYTKTCLRQQPANATRPSRIT